ncbi:MAG: transposase [Deltaproteobacteria bacterium]|nr:transposase [Deltaproteobacteria bacterium]
MISEAPPFVLRLSKDEWRVFQQNHNHYSLDGSGRFLLTPPHVPSCPRVFAPGLLYHVIVRGNQRRKTFRCADDYKAYLDRLENYRAKCNVRIYAYCLMPNHVHLLVETGSTPLAKFMQGLQ